jgi:hypothetical protein
VILSLRASGSWTFAISCQWDPELACAIGTGVAALRLVPNAESVAIVDGATELRAFTFWVSSRLLVAEQFCQVLSDRLGEYSSL